MSNTNKELLDDLKKVIYEILERYAKANSQEIDSFYVPELVIKQSSGKATISLAFSSNISDKKE